MAGQAKRNRMTGYWLLTFLATMLLTSSSPFSANAQAPESTPESQHPMQDLQTIGPSVEPIDLAPAESPPDRIEQYETHISQVEGDSEFSCFQAICAVSMFAAGKLSDVAHTMGPLPRGLTRSRWAMEDAEYAAKYANGADRTDIAGKVKQASDARFIDGSSGWYLSGGITSLSESDHPLASLEAGYEGYWKSYLTTRLGICGAVNDDDGYLGAELGLRVQTPTRLAPFVGTGLFGGFASQSVPADNDGIDNDDDHAIDEIDEVQSRISGALAGVYPEMGIHFWWSPRVRFTGYGRYLVTTEGRDADSWLYGVGIALMSGP
jgi:hypothetical protein